MAVETPFYRVRWTIRARADLTLHTHQHAILYAVLCEAARGASGDGRAAMPEGLLLDAPEGGRFAVAAGEEFAFGATLIEADPDRASSRLHDLCAGLIRLGAARRVKPVALGGNFDLVNVEDLVAGRPVAPGEPFASLPMSQPIREFERLESRLGQPITLRFLSPLRLELPEREAKDGHRYADGARLIPGQLLRAIQKRLAAVGFLRSAGGDPPFDDEAVALAENRLVWLDLGYGSWDQRKSLGGAVGRVRLLLRDPTALGAVVWGQYARVGRNLHFGFGRYRVEELGADPTTCRRATTLLALAMSPERVARAAAEHDLEAKALQSAADGLIDGTYRPSAPRRLTLREPDGGTRDLRVPGRQDRALQRLILARIGPACDRLFETSSFAWRKGLSREAAARRIERLSNDGWDFAARADFDRFFDSIPRDALKDRLEAYLGDDACTSAVMTLAQQDADAGGLPTGAPLSPLLGNLFLDHFDERIERDGGRLVRYADDFLILTRTREEADRLQRRAEALAAELELALNADAGVIDLREPFTFLGFAFRLELEPRWRYTGQPGPIRMCERDGTDARRSPSGRSGIDRTGGAP